MLLVGLGALACVVLGGFFALMVASGGLYGSGRLSDGSWAEWSFGALFLLLSAIPLGVLGYLVYLADKKAQPHPLLVLGLWVVCVVGGLSTLLSMPMFLVFFVSLGVCLLTWPEPGAPDP